MLTPKIEQFPEDFDDEKLFKGMARCKLVFKNGHEIICHSEYKKFFAIDWCCKQLEAMPKGVGKFHIYRRKKLIAIVG